MSAPTAPRRTWKPATRPARRRRLHLGWIATGIIVTIAAINTWPLATGLAISLIATVLVLAATCARRRPRRNWAGVLSAIVSARGSHLPAPGARTLADFQRMQPYEFEHAIAELAREHPAVARAETVGGANDRGADVLVTLHNSHRILIQCKRYQPGNNVTSGDVQKTNGTYRDIHHCHQAVIVTTADFTPAAYQTNGMLPKPILLINGHGLEAWANGGHAPW